MARETRYRQYIIRSMPGEGGARARAFRGKVTAGDVQSAETEEAAIVAVKSELDRMHAEQLAQRGADGYPTAEEVRMALQHLSMTDAQSAMLGAHLSAPDCILTATQIAVAGGYDSWVSANSQYGMLGRRLAEELDWNPPLRPDGTPIWTCALATGADETGSMVDSDDAEEGHWRWKLRDQVRQALSDWF